MEIKSEISNLASNFLNKNFNIKADFIEIQNTKKTLWVILQLYFFHI